MMSENDDSRLEQQIRQAVENDDVRFDLGRWKTRHSDEASLLKSWNKNNSRMKRKLIMRIDISSSIAAGLLLAVGLTTMLVTNREANAAEQLQKVAETNAAYKGWIHMEASGRPKDPNSPILKGSEHLNTVDGTTARERIMPDGSRTVTMRIPGRRETVTYDSKSNTIRRTGMPAMTAKDSLKSAQASPMTIGAKLADFEKTLGRDPLKVVRKDEDGLERYNITLFKDEQEMRELCKDKAISPLFTTFTLWVNPQSQLIEKMHFVQQDIDVTARFSYGTPKIRYI